jgi:hypothetical protein
MRLARTSVLVLLALFGPREVEAQAKRPAAAVRVARPLAALSFEMSLSLGRLRAGEVVPVYLSALDANGKPTDATIVLDSDFGDLGKVARVAEGLYLATLTVPEVLAGRTSALLLARSDAVSSQVIVLLGPAEAAEVKLDGPAAVIADGESRARLEVKVEDPYGNAADEVPRASATRGSVKPAQEVGPGHWTIEYLPRRILDAEEDTLVVEVGPLRAEHAIRLDTRPTWWGLAPWTGAAMASGGNAVALGAGASWWRRFGSGYVGAVFDAAWWRLGERSPVALPGAALELDGDRSYLAATLSLSWGRRLGSRAFASFSAGAGAARVTSAQRVAGWPDVSESGWSPTVSAAAALGLRAWRGTPYLELRASWIGDPGLETLRGSTSPVLLIAGYRFDAR